MHIVALFAAIHSLRPGQEDGHATVLANGATQRESTRTAARESWNGTPGMQVQRSANPTPLAGHVRFLKEYFNDK